MSAIPLFDLFDQEIKRVPCVSLLLDGDLFKSVKNQDIIKILKAREFSTFYPYRLSQSMRMVHFD